MASVESLRLIRLGALGSFSGYIPENMRKIAEKTGNVCIGAVYDDRACGAAFAEDTQDGWFLRSVYIDPKARLCGLGTYLIRGLIGAVLASGARELTLMYTPGMLENGKISGAFERAGFSAPKPYSATFTTSIGAVTVAKTARNTEVAVELIHKAPALVLQHYHERLASGEFPEFADDGGFIFSPEPACCLLAYIGNRAIGALTVFHDEERRELLVRGLFVDAAYRGRGVAEALISHALKNAVRLYGPEYPVRASPITKIAYNLCDRRFTQNRRTHETIYYMTCMF